MIFKNHTRSLTKFFLFTFFLITTIVCKAQIASLSPGDNSFEKKFLKSAKYEWTCYSLDPGRNKTEISAFTVEIKSGSGPLSIYTNLRLPNSPDQWWDTSVVDANTFKPIYRASHNRHRELVVKYGKEVTGHYFDKKTKKRTHIKEPVKEAFFDSYSYPYLLGLLPLASGYNTSLTVYDYKPENSSNIKKAVIHEVKNSVHVSDLTGEHKCWQVSIHEEATGDKYDYYIDKDTRRIWKVEIFAGKQHLLMLEKELDFNPFKSSFDKVATMKMLKSGTGIISGEAFARDNQNEGALKGIAVLNINKKQYAKPGTKIVLIPYTEYFQEWMELNKASRKKGRSIPLPAEVSECMKVTTVYDDKGKFEFVNLMPGEYMLYTEFSYVHTSIRTDVTGYSDRYLNGLYQGTIEHTTVNAYEGNTSAGIKKVVTIKKEGEKVEVKLRKTL
jgi:hypothetical protein